MINLEELHARMESSYSDYLMAENQTPDQLKLWLKYSDAKSAYQAALEQLRLESIEFLP